MVKYCLKRIGMAVITVIIIIVILFCLLKLMPGSPFNNERLTEDQRVVLYEKYGLDKPLPEQIIIYIKNMLTGDFGVSYNIQQNYPVSQLIANRYPITIPYWSGSLYNRRIAGTDSWSHCSIAS